MLEGFELALCGKQRRGPPVPSLLGAEQEAQLTVLRPKICAPESRSSTMRWTAPSTTAG